MTTTLVTTTATTTATAPNSSRKQEQQKQRKTKKPQLPGVNLEPEEAAQVGYNLIPVVPARGGAEVALDLIIRPFSSIELARAVRRACLLCANLLFCCCSRT